MPSSSSTSSEETTLLLSPDVFVARPEDPRFAGLFNGHFVFDIYGGYRYCAGIASVSEPALLPANGRMPQVVLPRLTSGQSLIPLFPDHCSFLRQISERVLSEYFQCPRCPDPQLSIL